MMRIGAHETTLRRTWFRTLLCIAGLAGTALALTAVLWGRDHALAATSTGRSTQNGQLTIFGTRGRVSIKTVGSNPRTVWDCWHHHTQNDCHEPVSFAWAPGGRRVAFTNTYFGGGWSSYVWFHIVYAASGRETRIPPGAPKESSYEDRDQEAWDAYYKKTVRRVGCTHPEELAWSPSGKRLAYACAGMDGRPIVHSHIDVLTVRGVGHISVPTRSNAFWPSWSSRGTRIAYSTQLTPATTSRIYTIAVDGSHRFLLAEGGAAPAWSPDGRTIAYQTTCGIRLVTPAGRDVTPAATANSCGAIGVSGPPVWSPDGTKIAAETTAGVYVMGRGGAALHLISKQASRTWYGLLPGRPSWRSKP